MVMRHHFFQQHCNHNVHQGLQWIQDPLVAPGYQGTTRGLPSMLKKRTVEIPAKRDLILPGKRSVPFFWQQWLVLGVKLMEINSNLFSR